MALLTPKIKLYIMNYGKYKIFQTDNGTEFKNSELKTFLENEGIKQVLSRVYHPQSMELLKLFIKK